VGEVMNKIQIKKDSKILFIGDSISDPMFNFRMMKDIKGRNIYALQLKKKFKKHSKKISVHIKGIASNRTYHVYDRLTKDCINLKPDVIIMLIGINDAWENYVPEEYPPLLRPIEPHIREIFRRIKMELPDTQVLYLMPFMIDAVEAKFPFHKKLDECREILESAAHQYGATVLDLQETFYEAQKTIEPKKLAIDGIHPTNLGHKVMAEAVENIIEYV
jgi:lysophospholipase L1-like esterase